jgi:hypothetical protein
MLSFSVIDRFQLARHSSGICGGGSAPNFSGSHEGLAQNEQSLCQSAQEFAALRNLRAPRACPERSRGVPALDLPSPPIIASLLRCIDPSSPRWTPVVFQRKTPSIPFLFMPLRKSFLPNEGGTPPSTLFSRFHHARNSHDLYLSSGLVLCPRQSRRSIGHTQRTESHRPLQSSHP